MIPVFELSNARRVSDGVLCAGELTPQQLREMAAAGMKTVVNLCVPGESDWDEGGFVNGLGMRYVNIPVRGAVDVTEENAHRLHEIVAQAANRPLVIHCRSGNRVGALLAIAACRDDGRDVEEAVELGRRAGLAALEPHVRQVLSKVSASHGERK